MVIGQEKKMEGKKVVKISIIQESMFFWYFFLLE